MQGACIWLHGTPGMKCFVAPTGGAGGENASWVSICACRCGLAYKCTHVYMSWHMDEGAYIAH